MKNVYVVSAVRTAIGAFGGTLKDQSPAELGTAVIKGALAQANLEADSIENVVFGQVIPTSAKDAYLSRVAAVNAGIPLTTPALTLNRLCGSGLQAIICAAQSIMLDDCDIAIGAGAEVMSQAPFMSHDMRWGKRMGGSEMSDTINDSLTDPFHNILMGITAENVAEKFSISREQQDALALESQTRAIEAIKKGRFSKQIIPIFIRKRGKTTEFSIDEHVKDNVTLEKLAALRTIFKSESGTVTAGNASGINDGASALILASESAVNSHNLTPMARLVSYGITGVDPKLMGIGPVSATLKALSKAGLSINDMDVIESNEAFAAQACAVAQELNLDPKKVNPNGSGIALGHPVGATGAIITTKLIHELCRTGGRYGLATMCIGGGQGIAAIFERV